MKNFSLIAALAGVAASTQLAHAGSWRCVDDPQLPDCEESLLNDIEDAIDFYWPVPLTIEMPPLPYSCSKKPGSGHQSTPEDGEIHTQVLGQISWTAEWTGDLRYFLIGRYTATAEVAATVRVSGGSVATTEWPSNVVSYLFQEGATDVMAPAGSTGVRDLGLVLSQNPSGAFWSAPLQLSLNLSDGDWTCTIGPAGYQVSATGHNTVRANYPVAWTQSGLVLAQMIRERFRSAVRLVVTGAP